MKPGVASTDLRIRDQSGFDGPLRQPLPAGLSREDLRQILAVIATIALFSVPMIGSPGSAVFLAASGAMMVLAPFKTGRHLLIYGYFLVIPVMALASTFWSDAPERTARAGLQLLVTMVAAIAIANTLSARAMIRAVLAVSAVTCVIALLYVPDTLATGSPLHGPFETKNPMGFAMVLALAASLAVMADGKQPASARIAAIPVLGVSQGLLLLSRSGNAYVGAALVLAVIAAIGLARHVGIYARIALLLFCLALAAVAMVYLAELQVAAADFVQNVLKKDMTLTGRTLIWDVADGLVAENPALGHGYYAFWRIGNVEAEALWRQFGITSRSGFNFHSAFVEMAVDLGWTGLVALLAICVGTGLVVLYRQLVSPTMPGAFFLAMLVVIYTRSYTETGLIAPFSTFTGLWIWSCIYAMQKPAPEQPGRFPKPARARP
jgi:exopolysaccharide production protein ExoQ